MENNATEDIIQGFKLLGLETAEQREKVLRATHVETFIESNNTHRLLYRIVNANNSLLNDEGLV